MFPNVKISLRLQQPQYIKLISKASLLIATTISLLFFSKTASANPPAIYILTDSNTQRIPISCLEVLSVEVDTISAFEAYNSQDWINAEDYSSYFGWTKKTAWVRINVQNASNETDLLVEYQMPFVKHIDYYADVDNGIFEPTVKTGINLTSEKEYKDPYYYFDLHLDNGGTTNLLFKLQTGQQISLPFKIVPRQHLYSNSYKNRQLIYGIFFGIMLLTILYNLIIYLSTRLTIYLIYVLYTLFVSLTQFCAIGIYQNYFPFLGESFNNHALYVFVDGIGICGLYFLYLFVEVKKHVPKLSFAFVLLVASYVTSFIFLMTGLELASYLLIQANSIVGCTFAFLLSMYIGFAKKQRSAFTFLIAWTPFLVGNILFMFKDFGVLPYSELTRSGIWVGAAIQGVMLTVALADLISSLRKEKLSSQLLNLKMAQNNQDLQLELKDAQLNSLQRQMNPHFIFNALNSIRNHLNKHSDEMAGMLLEEFSRLIRTSLVHSRQQTIPISEELHFLKTYLDVEKLRFPDRFNYQLYVEKELENGDTALPPLLLQPICENAVKHAFQSREQLGTITVDIRRYNEKSILCEISDNGCGIGNKSRLKRNNYKKQSLGLKIIEQRLELLKTQGHLTNLTIEDLSNPSAHTTGTRVELILPNYEVD